MYGCIRSGDVRATMLAHDSSRKRVDPSQEDKGSKMKKNKLTTQISGKMCDPWYECACIIKR